jgi:two-component system, NarL family, response regulator
MTQANIIRIAIADDHSVLREGLTALIGRAPGMEVVAQASNWPDTIQNVMRSKASVAVVDLHMPGMEPAVGVATLREKCPATQVVVFSAFGTEQEIYDVLCAGARGYAFKGETGASDLVKCIHAVADGEMWIHPDAAARLAQHAITPDLTTREKDVLQLLVAGKSNKEIGSSLDVTEGTVKVHVNHIFAKLDVGGRVEAIAVAVKRGLVQWTENKTGSSAASAEATSATAGRQSGQKIYRK